MGEAEKLGPVACKNYFESRMPQLSHSDQKSTEEVLPNR